MTDLPPGETMMITLRKADLIAATWSLRWVTFHVKGLKPVELPYDPELINHVIDCLN